MRESPLEVLTGALVLLVAGVFLTFALSRAGWGGGGGNGAVITASFRAVEGITPGTDVRMAGVKIGSVASMHLSPQTFRAEVAMAMDGTVPIPDDSSAVIASEGLLGGNYVEIFPGGSLTNLADGGEIYDTQGSVSLLQLLIQYIGGGGDTPAPAP